MSPTSTRSPSPNIHSFSVFSVADMPTFGMRNSSAIASAFPVHCGAYRIGDLILVRDPRLFERIRHRHRGEGPTDARHLRLQLAEQLFVEPRGDFGVGAILLH